MRESLQEWANIAQILSLPIAVLSLIVAILTWLNPPQPAVAAFFHRVRPYLLTISIAAFTFWLGTRTIPAVPSSQTDAQATIKEDQMQATVFALQTQLAEARRQASTSSSPISAAAAPTGVPATPGNTLSNTTLPSMPTDTAVPPTPKPPTPTVTPESPAGSDLLYQADWSAGLNGWFGSQDWKTLNGMLINDGAHDGIGLSITAPYSPNTADYAIEAEIQVVRPLGCSSFGIVARADKKETGYQAGINYCEFHGAAFYSMPELGFKEFDPGTKWHTYRLEVKGNTIKFFIDEAPVMETSDNRYLSGGQVGLWNDNVQLNVRSFKVMKLDR
jgi:hypothetical protein